MCLGLLGHGIAPPLVVLAPTMTWQVISLLYFGASISFIIAPTMPAISDIASRHASLHATESHEGERATEEPPDIDPSACLNDDQIIPSTALLSNSTDTISSPTSSPDHTPSVSGTNGTAYSLLNICWALGGTFGPLVAPILKEHVGLVYAMTLFTLLMWGFAPIYAFAMWRRKRKPTLLSVQGHDTQ